jgi:catechol 2,3-dioxygenase-like lactoylglutathione lyase family enzyme
MKRLHIHIAVNDLSESINFYSVLFGNEPTVKKEDYAKWDLTEPAINFAISKRGHTSGINHLGIQVDSEEELEEIASRLDSAEITTASQEGSSCCYAHSNKHWSLDPQGIAWESFHTLGEIPVFGKDTKTDSDDDASACCIPLSNTEPEKNDAACCISNESNENDASGCCT